MNLKRTITLTAQIKTHKKSLDTADESNNERYCQDCSKTPAEERTP